MRVLLRLLAPLLGIALAAAGVLLVIEVVAAWVRSDAAAGLIAPWHSWRAVLEELTWADDPVPAIAVGAGVIGLLLVLLGLSARRSDIHLVVPSPEMTVTTSPRVLARLVGRRVRASEDVAAATVTASASKISVSAQGWGDTGPELKAAVIGSVDGLLDELPLHRRPRVVVSVMEGSGAR